ncbi:unnamed protein product, partial [Candidula unifasciata]
ETRITRLPDENPAFLIARSAERRVKSQWQIKNHNRFVPFPQWTLGAVKTTI